VTRFTHELAPPGYQIRGAKGGGRSPSVSAVAAGDRVIGLEFEHATPEALDHGLVAAFAGGLEGGEEDVDRAAAVSARDVDLRRAVRAGRLAGLALEGFLVDPRGFLVAAGFLEDPGRLALF